MSDTISPLKEGDLQNINEAIKRLDDAQSLIEQATRAGINVEVFKKRQLEARDRLTKVKQAFFPGK